jgi:hypothetical protein
MCVDVVKNLMFALASDHHCWPYVLFDLARMFHKPHARFFHVILGSFSFVYMLTLVQFRRIDRDKLQQWFDIHLNQDQSDRKSIDAIQTSSQMTAHLVTPAKMWMCFDKVGLNVITELQSETNPDKSNKHVQMLNDHRSYFKHRKQEQKALLSRPSQVLTPDFLVDRLKLLLQIERAHRALQAMAQLCVISFSATTSGYFVVGGPQCHWDWIAYATLTAAGWIHSMFAFYLYNRTLVLQNALYLSDALQLLHALKSLHTQLHLLAVGHHFSARRRALLLRRLLRHVQHVHGHFRHSSRYFNQVFGISFFVAFFSSVFLLFALVHFNTNAVEKSILICCTLMLITMYSLLPSLINSAVQAAVSSCVALPVFFRIHNIS